MLSLSGLRLSLDFGFASSLGLGFGVSGLGFRVSDSGFRVSAFRFGVSGFRFRVGGEASQGIDLKC